MNAPAGVLPTHTGSTACGHTDCFHCGEPLPPQPQVRGEGAAAQLFCCAGCEAAAQWIHQARLDDYYRLRSATAGRVGTDNPDLGAWDREDVIAPHVRAVPGGREIVVATDGMRCAACAWLIDRALSREAGVAEISANAVTGRIRLVWNPAERRLSAILARLQALGYRPWLAGHLDIERARRDEWRRWLLRLGLAGIATLQAMMFAEALYLDTARQMPEPTRDFFRWLTFLLATPVVFYAGSPFLAGAWRDLSQRRAGMDVLVATSILLAWGASTVEILRGGAHVWFDAAVMFVFLLLAARVLELRTRQVANQRIDALARARPVLAQRETAGGGCESVPLGQVQPGDVLRVAAGEHLPVDGELLDTPAAFDESLLSGESRPVSRAAGATVLAGSVAPDHSIRLRVTATGTGTRLSALERLVAQAQAHRPRMAVLADRVASWFVLGMALLATLVWLRWQALEPARAFEVTLALLVISCPCALSLAVPAALAAAHARLSALGVLVLRPDALERMATIDTVVFDKTGTLGDNRWEIESITPFGDCSVHEARALAAALEQDSQHPLASAFTSPGDQRRAQGVIRHAGEGIAGTVDGRALRLGRAAFAAGQQDDDAIWLGDGHTPRARFVLRGQPRTDSPALLARLAAMGLRLHILSGDAQTAVSQFAQRLGTPVDTATGRLLPEDKLARVRTLQQRGHRVAMVGDGINDAPVLAGADVSVALGDGSALARQSADLVLLHPAMTRIADLLAVARRTRRIVRQNLAWAIGYNLVALPAAALGHVEPWAAALAMVASSLTVTLNALRLTRATT